MSVFEISVFQTIQRSSHNVRVFWVFDCNLNPIYVNKTISSFSEALCLEFKSVCVWLAFRWKHFFLNISFKTEFFLHYKFLSCKLNTLRSEYKVLLLCKE